MNELNMDSSTELKQLTVLLQTSELQVVRYQMSEALKKVFKEKSSYIRLWMTVSIQPGLRLCSH